MAASPPGARSKISDSVFKNPGIYIYIYIYIVMCVWRGEGGRSRGTMGRGTRHKFKCWQGVYGKQENRRRGAGSPRWREAGEIRQK